MPDQFDVAVVGATGAVGEAMLSILAERDFPMGKLYALASERSLGKDVDYGNRSIPVDNLADFDFSKVQIALSADLALQKYFTDNLPAIEKWFNVISPTGQSIDPDPQRTCTTQRQTRRRQRVETHQGLLDRTHATGPGGNQQPDDVAG